MLLCRKVNPVLPQNFSPCPSLPRRQNGTLHPAVENDVALKRYLRRISEGVCCVLMDPRDIQRPIPRALIRELVTACVMRPAIGMFTPNYINNLLLGE